MSVPLRVALSVDRVKLSVYGVRRYVHGLNVSVDGVKLSVDCVKMLVDGVFLSVVGRAPAWLPDGPRVAGGWAWGRGACFRIGGVVGWWCEAVGLLDTRPRPFGLLSGLQVGCCWWVVGFGVAGFVVALVGVVGGL